MKAFIKILLWLLLPTFASSQQNKPDSFQHALAMASTDSARFYINRQLSTYYAEDNRDSALYYSERCLKLAQKNNNNLFVASALSAKGYLLMHQGKPAESLQCFLEAVKIADDPKNENIKWSKDTTLTPQKNRLNVLADIHHNWGHLMGNINTDEQIMHYKKTKNLVEKTGDSGLLGLVHMNLGSVYFELHKYDSALVFEKIAEQIFRKISFLKYLSYVNLRMGDIYLKKNNKVLAVENYHKSIQSASEQNNLAVLSYTYDALIEYFTNGKNKDSSLYYSKRNLELLQSMGTNDLSEAYSNLYKSYQLNNKIDSAYKYQGLAIIAKDSLYKAGIKNLSELQKLSFKEQQRLQELEQEKIQSKNKTRNYAMLAALGIFLFIALLLYRNNRQKQKANKILETTLSNLKATQSQLIQSEKMASLGELTAGIAHEIQNPLNFVNNFSEVNRELLLEMKDEIDKGNINEVKSIANDLIDNQEKINQHGKRADAIVKGMLQHSRTSSGQKQLTDINSLADEYLRLSYHGLRAKDKSFNADFKTDFDENIGNINIVPQDIGRVLLNLYNNAFYALAEKNASTSSARQQYAPTITVTTKRLNDKVEIRVKDNGNGIPQKVVDKIFQPFFTTKPTGQGTGLGLSLSYDIIKAHGGEINVETKESEGSEFIIQLPIN